MRSGLHTAIASPTLAARRGAMFEGVRGCARRPRPEVVICENACGLLKHTQGCDAQIHVVRK
eukprot:10619178-Lingulodinium_polyedra.AAC.1